MAAPNTTPDAHILVVDDDREIRLLLKRFLSRSSYRVSMAKSGREMLTALEKWRIDLVILDLMLPGEDGLTLCRNLRARSEVPVVMLTVMSEETDRIIGLEMGADDYVAKPFNPRELLARIKAVLRRARAIPPGSTKTRSRWLSFAGWRLDLGTRRVTTANGIVVDLGTAEFDLLAAFVEHPQTILTRDQLLDLTRGRAETPFERSIDMQVSRLRRKIEADPKDPLLIVTVRGGGYMFTPEVRQSDEADT